MSENDSCCCSCSATKPAVKLNERQEELVEALYQAYRRNFYGQPNESLTMSDWEGVVTDDDTAYAVQDAVMAKKMGPVAGYKVSLTSEETQKMFDSDSPLYGAQVAERFVPTPCTLDLRHLNEPLVEVEFCFTAKKDLSADMSLDELLHNCTVAGDMEVPDARFKAWFPTLSKYLVMSDCAVAATCSTVRRSTAPSSRWTAWPRCTPRPTTTVSSSRRATRARCSATRSTR